MKLNKFFAIALIALVGFTMACGSTQKTEEVRSVSSGFGIDAANEQLAKIPVVGFPPYQSSMPMSQFDKYGENAATVAKGVVATLPEGYKIQLTGHANANSGRSAAFVKNISTQRAVFVKNYLVKKGLAANKLVTVGAGDSQQDPNLSKENNRRVTFSVVEAK
ncbi:MAG TPA: OmpA family protein [Turneriella sp.]|nr:OmpA family protein [Turneriella sp.]